MFVVVHCQRVKALDTTPVTGLLLQVAPQFRCGGSLIEFRSGVVRNTSALPHTLVPGSVSRCWLATSQVTCWLIVVQIRVRMFRRTVHFSGSSPQPPRFDHDRFPVRT